MTKEPKKIASIEILHLDETGYGPEREHTRQQWRDECLRNLVSGKDNFLEWQKVSLRKFERAQHRLHEMYSIKFGRYEVKRSADNTRSSTNFDFCLDFSGQTLHDLDVGNYQFLIQTNFAHTIFSGKISFHKVKFHDEVSFRYSEFNDLDNNFTGAVFSQNTDFDDANFNRADFKDTTYLEYVSFINATFGVVWFDRAKFRGWKAAFERAKFKGDVSFKKAEFKSDAGFREAKFYSRAMFHDVQFEGISEFEAAEFLNYIFFENCSFERYGDFRKAIFKNHIPVFFGCKIDKTQLEFSKESEFPATLKTSSNYQRYGEFEDYDEEIRGVSYLKRISDHYGQLDNSLKFNAIELNYKKQVAKKNFENKKVFSGFIFLITNSIYEHVSDFGRSFTQPLKYYAVLLLVTWLLALFCAVGYAPQLCQSEEPKFYPFGLERYVQLKDLNTCKKPKKAIPRQLIFTGFTAATEYTLYRTSGFIHFADKGKQMHDINRRLFDSPVEPWLMRLWGLFTSFASTILFFFIALGLRNCYRIK